MTHLRLELHRLYNSRKLKGASIALAVCHLPHSFPLSLSGRLEPLGSRLSSVHPTMSYITGMRGSYGNGEFVSTSHSGNAGLGSHNNIILALTAGVFSCPMRAGTSTPGFLSDLNLAGETNIQDVLAILKFLLAWHLPSPHQLRALSYVSLGRTQQATRLVEGTMQSPEVRWVRHTCVM